MKNLLKTLFVAAAALGITVANAQTDRTKEVKDTKTKNGVTTTKKTVTNSTNGKRTKKTVTKTTEIDAPAAK